MRVPEWVHEAMERGDLPKPKTLECSIHGEQVVSERENQCPMCTEVKQRAEEQRQRRLEQAGLPPRFIGGRLDSYRVESEGQKTAVESVRSLVTREVDSLIFSGGVGTGKTHLAAAAIHEWEDAAWANWENRGIARYTTADRLVREIKESWSQPDVSEESILNKYGNCGLLVIDELGSGFGSETETQYLSHVVGRRYDLEKPIILASNLSMEYIRDQGLLDERAVDRLREMARLVVFDWESERARKAI